MPSNNVCTEILIEAIECFYTETGYAPRTVSVRTANLVNLIKEAASQSRYPIEPMLGFAQFSIETYCGVVSVRIDNDMPDEIDYYFDDDVMRWLDKAAEDILLRGL